jgi:hypothetical protein
MLIENLQLISLSTPVNFHWTAPLTSGFHVKPTTIALLAYTPFWCPQIVLKKCSVGESEKMPSSRR